MFNDTFEIRDSNNFPVPFTTDGVIWEIDRDVKFKNPTVEPGQNLSEAFKVRNKTQFICDSSVVHLFRAQRSRQIGRKTFGSWTQIIPITTAFKTSTSSYGCVQQRCLLSESSIDCSIAITRIKCIIADCLQASTSSALITTIQSTCSTARNHSSSRQQAGLEGEISSWG
jgi:hypothetical protein